MKKYIFVFLWLFGGFGMLGLHRFYLGYKISGFIWLFSFGAFMIGAIYDIYHIDKLIAESEGNEYQEKNKRSTNKERIPSNGKNIPKEKIKSFPSKVIGIKINYIIIYNKGHQQSMKEDLIGVFGQAEARRLIEAKYMSSNVKRIAWVSDFSLYE